MEHGMTLSIGIESYTICNLERLPGPECWAYYRLTLDRTPEISERQKRGVMLLRHGRLVEPMHLTSTPDGSRVLVVHPVYQGWEPSKARPS